MAITPLPTPPSRDDPTNFSTRADAFLGALPDFATEANALAVDVSDDAAAAAAAALAATAAADVTKWVSGTTYAEGVVTWSPITFYSYRRKTAGAGTTDPSADATNWSQISGTGNVTENGTQTLTNKTIAYADNTLTGVQPTLVSGTSIKTINSTSLLGSGDIAIGSGIIRVERTSNTELSAANSGNLIDITSGTFTQTFAAAATLGDGWFVYIENSGTGNITLDPSSSETIDGLTSFIMYPAEVRLIQCDGTALRSIVLNSFVATFTASGTFTKPPGYSYFSGLIWGGGGSGARTGTASYQPGHGGGGACVPFNVPNASVGSSVTVTVGAGGAARTNPVTGGGNVGGTSSFGTIVSAYGGGGGGFSASANSGSGGGGGALSAGSNGTNGGTTTVQGGGPVNSAATDISNDGFGGGAGRGSTGGDSAYGGGGGNGGNSIYGGGGGANGTSVFGGAGGGFAADGTAPAGGGGGAQTQTSSGAGARGELRIWGII